MNDEIKFSFYEINALNMLLEQIKSEAYMTADEINFYALSPIIISAFKKIHTAYITLLSEMKANGKLDSAELQEIDPENGFQLTEATHIENRKKRILNLNVSGQEHIRKLDKKKREEYCDLIFAPFKPTEGQRKEILELLESVTANSNK